MHSYQAVMGYVAGVTPAAAHAPKIVDKPWGREVWWADEDMYAGKLLAVTEGKQLSLQKHNIKKETLMVMSGQVEVRLGETRFTALAGTAFTIEPGTIHRFTALQDSVLLEVSTPHLDDVVRLEDDYNRI